MRWYTYKEQQTNRNKAKKTNGIPVYQLDDQGNIIKRWDKIVDATEALNIPIGKISEVCRGRRNRTRGYKWKYALNDDIKDEIWKKYHDIEVSNKGRVKSVYKRVNHGRKCATGYMQCNPYKGKDTVEVVHVIVAKLFIPNPNNLPKVNHKDGDKTNNIIENLEWITSSGNAKHAHDNGLVSNGGQKRKIKVDMYTLDGKFIRTYESIGEAAKDIGIHSGAVSKVCQGIFKQTKGFSFKFHEKQPRNRTFKAKQIDAYDQDMNFLKTYYSPMEAAIELKVSPSNIHLVCKGTYKQTGGYKFKYA